MKRWVRDVCSGWFIPSFVTSLRCQPEGRRYKFRSTPGHRQQIAEGCSLRSKNTKLLRSYFALICLGLWRTISGWL